jgi:hypothetical protein
MKTSTPPPLGPTSSGQLHTDQKAVIFPSMKPELPPIKIGTLAERLQASANVPLDQALAGVRAHGPQPTQANPSLAAWEYFQKSQPKSLSKEPSTSSTATVPNTTSSLIPQQAG